MSSSERGFAGVESILGKMRLPKEVKDHLKNHEIWSKWYEIVGFELSRVTYPSELKGKTLLINVAHQAWAQQLHFLKISILGKIRGLCPQSQISDLQFRVGKVIPTAIPELEVPPEKRAVPARLSERLEMTLRAVEDPDLRASIRKAMEAQAAISG